MPVDAGIRGVTIAGLPEVGRPGVKLSPADRDLVAICRVNCDGRLVRGVTDDVVSILIDVHLVADEAAVRGDQPRRGLESIGAYWRRRHPGFFQWLGHATFAG